VRNPLAILQVSTSDEAGGAERSAKNLFGAYRKLGHESWLAVGTKRGTDSGVFEIPNEARRNAWVRAMSQALNYYESQPVRVKGIGSLMRVLREFGQPLREIHRQLGMDDFDYPATRYLAQLPHRTPDIIHFHNLHGNYFDLRCLPEISRRIPSVLNLRDAWMASGHCAFSFGCERWKTGCGHCPDLNIFPAIKRDGTAHNFEKKRKLLQKSRLYVTTPSQWLMHRVEKSIIEPAIIERKVIPNGVDTDIFYPSDKAAARAQLNLEQDVEILLTAANGIRCNIWKDYKTLRDAIEILAKGKLAKKTMVLAVGEASQPEMIGNIMVRFVPFQQDLSVMARYYRAADVYLHTAKVESFGNVLLEARACGTPVVTTAVGGIPEHVKGLDWDQMPSGIPAFGQTEATGILTPAGDSVAFAKAITVLLERPELRFELGQNGYRDAAGCFSLSLQATRFLEWYGEILSREPLTETGQA
jgi:glycosyltransferase involved in cell wall biosynthesis